MISRQNLNLVRLPIPPLSRANHGKLAQPQDYQTYFPAGHSVKIHQATLLPRSSKSMIPLYESAPFYGSAAFQHKLPIPRWNKEPKQPLAPTKKGPARAQVPLDLVGREGFEPSTN
jgi:hypothetical protein